MRRIAGHFDAAEQWFHQALRLAETFFGPDSEETAWVCNDLGMVGKFAGHFTAAAQWYARALTILTAQYGPEDRALAVAIKATLFDADHVELALTLHNLAMLYTAMARDDEAGQLLCRALTIFTRTLHDAHPQVRACREHLAAVRGKPRT